MFNAGLHPEDFAAQSMKFALIRLLAFTESYKPD